MKNMQLRNSLFLEDLHHTDLVENYEFDDLVENLLMQADLQLYEGMDNLTLNEGPLSDPIIYMNPDLAIIKGLYNLYLNTVPKYQKSADNIIERYKKIPKEYLNDDSRRLRDMKECCYGNNLHGGQVVDIGFINGYYARMRDFLKEFKNAGKENNDKRKNYLSKKIDKLIGIRVYSQSIFGTGEIMMGNGKKYLENYVKFVKSSFSNFKKLLDEVKNEVKKYQEENWNSIKKFMLSKLKKFVRNSMKLISAYTFNANIVLRSFEKHPGYIKGAII
jgi:Sec-independent protein translocase protein TatA